MSDSYNETYEKMLAWRNIYVVDGDKPCERCYGSGIKMYASTSTWRGGIGGMSMTNDVCDNCWGSGNAEKPWTNLRARK